MAVDDVGGIWAAEAEHVGSTPVLRALPSSQASSVGPFVFLDHFGPAPTRPGTLAAHPHAGIEVMTYLIEGANTHRDSAGNTGSVAAGGAQWMRAGGGVLHAETITDENAPVTHGLQFWAKLPRDMQDATPAYRGYDAAEFPVWADGGARLKLLSGSLAGRTGPMALALDAFMLHVTLDAGATIAIALNGVGHRYGVYVIGGRGLRDQRYGVSRGDFALLAEGTTNLTVSAESGGALEIFVLGGAPAPQPLHFGGPFVMDSREGLIAAQRRYAAGAMGTLDGVPF